MFRSFGKCALVILVACLITSTSVFAQATEEAEAGALVLRAFDGLARNGNYHFVTENTSSSKVADADGQTISTNYGHSLSIGDVASNGDYQFDSTRTTDQTIEAAQAQTPFHGAVVSVAGEKYVNLLTENTPYVKIMGVEAGWWRYAVLAARLKNGTRSLIQSFDLPHVPLQLMDNPGDIQWVTKLGTETLEGVETQIYRVKIDPLTVIMRATGPGSDELLQNMDIPEFVASSSFDIHYQFWIGIEDGRLYRLELQSHLDMPHYFTFGRHPMMFHASSSSSGESVISYPDQPIIIAAPDAALLHK
ncbi:MAG: hypothetical protein ABI700_13410 [Chloroflexota bacterium]